jgi:sorbitol-specific phosphotransferase system component IIBC
MNNVKLVNKSMIGILDPTRVNQASHTVNLRKESEMYKDRTMKQFNKEVTDMSKNISVRVSLYIAKAMHVFVKGGKTTIKILYFLSKFHLYFQLCIEI